ncbi:MAG: ATPase [Ruminococcus sp.]|nr:ATPase [Ruminococcus sp.]
MPSIERMTLVNIAGMSRDIDATLRILGESGCFHIESASKISGKTRGFDASKELNPYLAPLKILQEIQSRYDVSYTPTDYSIVEGQRVEKITAFVKDLIEKLDSISEEKKNTLEHLSLREQAISQLDHLTGLNIDFQRLFHCEHVKVRFGRIPIDSYHKLPYYNDKLFYFTYFSEEKEYLWGVYFVPNNFAEEVDEIFNSLYFERMRVPDFVQGTAVDARDVIRDEIVKDKEKITDLNNQINEILRNERERLNMLYSRIKTQHDHFVLRDKAIVVNNKFYIVGFIPQKEEQRFQDHFKELTSVSIVMQPADENGKLPPPIKLNNNKFSEPFAMFVEMYGLPSYNGFNPTNLVAITYTLLFGMMFGDLGQGIVVFLIGLYLANKKKMAMGRIFERIGISSAIFGFIYGSVFGFEHLLDPVFKILNIPFLPFRSGDMNNAMNILIAAIGIGVFIMLMSIMINIITGIKSKDFEGALFANNGLAGFIFYGAIIAGLVSVLLGHSIFSVPYVIGLIVVPVLMMFFREPLADLVKGKKFKAESFAEFAVTSFFEVFEFLLGYASNTLSFVRIGGFVLSHAVMMSVVMMLMESVNGGAKPVVVIIGNLFVMGMEGLIVGIQVLRLEFYEIFSRFYKADGRAFEPVTVDFAEKK